MLLRDTSGNCLQLRRLLELDIVSAYSSWFKTVCFFFFHLSRHFFSVSDESRLSAPTVFFDKDFKSLLLPCMKNHCFSTCPLSSLLDGYCKSWWKSICVSHYTMHDFVLNFCYFPLSLWRVLAYLAILHVENVLYLCTSLLFHLEIYPSICLP